MTQPPDNSPSVSLHRFHDCGAISILNTGGQTVYMTAQQTRTLARELARLARDLERNTGLESMYGRGRAGAAFYAT